MIIEEEIKNLDNTQEKQNFLNKLKLWQLVIKIKLAEIIQELLEILMKFQGIVHMRLEMIII